MTHFYNEAMLIFKKGLIFYDLEWTGSELLQIGAVDETGNTFETTVLTDQDIHVKVAEKIQLETRQDSNGNRGVFDKRNQKFLNTTSLYQALQDFLDWIQKIYFHHGQALLISHGSHDIPVLFQSLAKFNLENLFLERTSEFVNYQDYLRRYHPSHPQALSDLVKLVHPGKSYNFHSALEDARALADVFFTSSNRKHDWRSNTSLVITNHSKFGFEYEASPPVVIPFVDLEKNSRFVSQLADLLNPAPGARPVVISDDWRVLVGGECRLFRRVMLPRCMMISVDGWVMSHQLEDNETVIHLLCVIKKKLVFKIQFRPDAKSTFMKRKILLNNKKTESSGDNNVHVFQRGTKITAKIQFKENKNPKVMFLLSNKEVFGQLEDIMKEISMQKEEPVKETLLKEIITEIPVKDVLKEISLKI